MGAIARTLFALALVLAVTPANAQPQPRLTDPRPILEERAHYPDGATGEAMVMLEVVVESDGGVGEIKVVDGDEPFAASAVEAVTHYRFAPAKRGDVPVRARIRIAVSFTPPPPPRKALPPPPEEPAAPDAPKPEAVQEVTVNGDRPLTKSPTEHRLGRAEIKVVPGAFGDPFRAIDMLPGVVPTISGLPYFYIRGSPPSAVGYYVDEVRLPYLFHFALGPGVVQPALIEEVTLHPAAYPGRYGRYAGAIVAGTTRAPATDWYGEAQIRIFDAGAYVEAPFANGRGTAGVGGRYSYTAGVISLFAKDITVDYHDYNVRASWKLDDRWRLSMLGIGSFDYASDKKDGVEQVIFASEFHRIDLRLDRDGGKQQSRIATTFGLDRTRLDGGRFAQDWVLGARARHSVAVTPEIDAEIGADVTIDFYNADLPSPYAVSKDDYDQAVALFGPRTETANGVWLSGTWHPWKGFDFTTTLRGDVFTSKGNIALGPSPRVSMRLPLLPRLSFLGAMGVAPQPPAFAIPVPAVGYSGLVGGLAYGYQKSVGLEVELPVKFTGRAVGFHHSYFNLRDFARDRGDFQFDEAQPLPHSPSQAYGLEVYLGRKLSERFAAYVSYTLSRSEIGSTETEKASVSPFDRTHVFQIGGMADLGRKWRISSRFLTYRGWPTDSGQGIAGEPPTGRLSPFYRVDARIEKRWSFRENGYIAFVIEGLNVTASTDTISRNCVTSGAGQCKDEQFGPLVVPSIGVEGAL